MPNLESDRRIRAGVRCECILCPSLFAVGYSVCPRSYVSVVSETGVFSRDTFSHKHNVKMRGGGGVSRKCILTKKNTYMLLGKFILKYEI